MIDDDNGRRTSMIPSTPIDPHMIEEEVRASLRLAADANPVRTAALMVLTSSILHSDSTPDSPSRETLVRLGDRWSPLLLTVLSTGCYRHAELRRVVNMLSRLSQESTVSQRMLTLRLRVLERDGLVARTVYPGKVPTVEYRLTPLGEGLARYIEALMRWCVACGDQMRAAQRAFDVQEQASSERRTVSGSRVNRSAGTRSL
jgi:DNA-binding HxlR family transcriptional regulator